MMRERRQRGQANLTAILILLGLIVTGVWIWKRIPPDLQDTVVEQGVPLGALVLVALAVVWTAITRLRRRRAAVRERDRLMTRFEREPARDKQLDLAFTLIELNGYRADGLERVAPAMKALLGDTLKTAVGDKQHRIRGMAASHLGVLQDPAVVPALLAALEDDHAYVRACAALGLGRLRAREAKAKLQKVMEDDWDQTVRSRAREALERIV